MEERNLLSIAYKHVTGTLRTSWRTVEGIEKQETTNGRATQREQALIRRQREKIELELADACKDLLDLLDRQLVPAAEPGEERVFYLKMHVPLPLLLPLPSRHPFLPDRERARGRGTGRATTTGISRNSRGVRSASAPRSSRSRRTRRRTSTRLARSRRGTRRASASPSTFPSTSTTSAGAPTARAISPSMRSTRPSPPCTPRRSTPSAIH